MMLAFVPRWRGIKGVGAIYERNYFYVSKHY